VWTLIPGVPIGCRSPRKRGPYSMPIHSSRANVPAIGAARPIGGGARGMVKERSTAAAMRT
jgi:hypothetical protein